MKFPITTLAILFTLTLGLARSSGQRADSQATGRTKIPAELVDRLEVSQDLVYSTHGDQDLKLDLYRPKAAADKPLPAIVCIHGGGWWQGNKQSHGPLAQALADHGYVTVSISYRLSGESPFPAAIEDCKAAVRFLRARAEEFGIDREHIGAIGLSAGGHLAALLATSGGVAELEGGGGHADQLSTIQAAVPMGAQSDFNAEHIQAVKRTPPTKPGAKPNIWVQFMNGTPREVPETYALASPLTHLDAGDPPMHFITGELDREATHAKPFRARMNELGIPEALTVIPEAPHGFLGRQAFFDQAVKEAATWFDTHLKP